MEVPNVSIVFIALCAAAMLCMTAWIGLLRGRLGVLRGHGGDPVLEKRIRIHGNFTETAPLTALALLSAELLGLADPWLWLAVASYMIGRIWHYVGYDRKDRGGAMALSAGAALLLGLWAVVALP